MEKRIHKKQRKAEKHMHGARRLVSFYEAAEELGVSYWTLWRGAEAEFFKTLYIGSRRMIPSSELARIAEYGFGGRKRRLRQGDLVVQATAVEARG